MTKPSIGFECFALFQIFWWMNTPRFDFQSVQLAMDTNVISNRCGSACREKRNELCERQRVSHSMCS